MKLNIFNVKALLPLTAMAVTIATTSCVNDLDVDPTIDESTFMVFDRDGNFNKVYANLALTGQVGPSGNQDIADIDEGTSAFLRQCWNMNELPTDEALCSWGDPGIPELNYATWDSSHGMVECQYQRLFFGVTLSNNFLQQTADDTSAEGIRMRAEVRFLRALYYTYLIDFFGDVPFLTEISTELAQQGKRADIFKFIETELKECAEDMAEPKTNTYGRADKAAAWMLLSRLYLNAEVYTGTPRWEDAAEYAKKVIDSDYSLSTTPMGDWNAYQLLFMADNDTNGAQNEIIFPIMFDGIKTQNWGGSMFLTSSTFKDDMYFKKVYKVDDKGEIIKDKDGNPEIDPEKSILNGAETWAGNRARPELVKKFFPATTAPQVVVAEMTKEANDDRALFYGVDRNVDNEEVSQFTDGFSVAKWVNKRADGAKTSDPQFTDIDFPMFRLAEAYLTFAEASARLGHDADAKTYIDLLRSRAHATTQPSYSLDDICDEWAREFFYEARRRMDLVRFGKFGGNSDYVWMWKGGAKKGTNFGKYRNIYAIPNNDVIVNSNIVQNPGY